MHAMAHAYAVTSRLQGETTGDRIREARTRAGISRQQLADKCGVAYISVYQWERGKYAPSSDNLHKIASACGVLPHELHGGWDAVSAAHGAPPSLERFLETAEGATVTETEHSALISMPWDREPTTLSYHYALQAIRSQQSPSEAVASAEETEEMLNRGLARGRRMLGEADKKKEPANRPGPRKR